MYSWADCEMPPSTQAVIEVCDVHLDDVHETRLISLVGVLISRQLVYASSSELPRKTSLYRGFWSEFRECEGTLRYHLFLSFRRNGFLTFWARE